MREIKFRAWDKKEKKMSLVAKIDFAFLKVTCYEEGKALIGYEFDFRDIVLMQYTGLKDKNDKEVYEGDVIHYTPTEMGRWFQCVDEGDFKIYWDDGVFEIAQGVTINKLASKDIKVIGNIYENSEQLEEK